MQYESYFLTACELMATCGVVRTSHEPFIDSFVHIVVLRIVTDADLHLDVGLCKVGVSFRL